jgi:hypothetical protein
VFNIFAIYLLVLLCKIYLLRRKILIRKGIIIWGAYYRRLEKNAIILRYSGNHLRCFLMPYFCYSVTLSPTFLFPYSLPVALLLDCCLSLSYLSSSPCLSFLSLSVFSLLVCLFSPCLSFLALSTFLSLACLLSPCLPSYIFMSSLSCLLSSLLPFHCLPSLSLSTYLPFFHPIPLCSLSLSTLFRQLFLSNILL